MAQRTNKYEEPKRNVFSNDYDDLTMQDTIEKLQIEALTEVYK